MPVPRLNIQKCKPSKDISKMCRIIEILSGMGYDVDNVHDAIYTIESKHIDKSKFDYPYGSFEEFKRHAMAGDLEMKSIESIEMSKETANKLDKDVREGRAWITY